jgi:hypothetical protein
MLIIKRVNQFSLLFEFLNFFIIIIYIYIYIILYIYIIIY